ncbi:HlyD family secretion protein [Falsihalocynthiibacter arcticus]|uniref:Secretion protein HlyD n=1 Tax=Falsihalocynthiibacter arcticus TaxID=1579316 RepID=A0A126UXW1_9RHOB|nr:HlyD family secretion protein [Falsihalocynthiibacter arcticus]AML50486.1 secretion protein HlyD [Falsihalocynthiibacter arcticus]
MNSLPNWLIVIINAIFPSFGEPVVLEYNGYAEGDYVYIASAVAGRIVNMRAREGESISALETLFQIDDSHQTAALHAAQAQVAVAQANLENLATGSRDEEIAVIHASLDSAKVDQRLAQSTLERTQRLSKTGSVSQARVDTDTALLQGANARVAQFEAQLHVAELPARISQRIAAEATHDAALAQLEGARSALNDTTVTAPIGGRVDKVFYEQGEVALAGAPVVSILPPESLKALFFIPEGERASVSLGEIFDVACSGCPDEITAHLTRLAATPQYTPPIIYSREERSRLVFRAESILENAGDVLPGQPLTLRPRD